MSDIEDAVDAVHRASKSSISDYERQALRKWCIEHIRDEASWQEVKELENYILTGETP